MRNLNEYCKDCSKKILESERIFEGYCQSCYEERFGKKYKRKVNFTATILQFIAVSIGIIGFLIGMANLQTLGNETNGIIIIIISIIGAVFINGFAVIIQLLENIYRKIN